MVLPKYWNRLIRIDLTFVSSYFEQPPQVLWRLMSIELKNYHRMEFPANVVHSEEYMKHYLLLLLTSITNLGQIKFYSNKLTYTFRKTAQSLSGLLYIQSTLWGLQAVTKCHSTCRCGAFVTVQQKAKKSGRAILSVIMNAGWRHSWKVRLPCKASSSVSTVSSVNWSSDEDARATEGESVASTVYPPSALCQCDDYDISV